MARSDGGDAVVLSAATTPTRPLASRRRGRPSARATPAPSDEVILRVAFDTFAERGFEATTVRDMADMLGISHGLLNARFGGKDMLWRRAVQHELDGQPQMLLDVLNGDFPDETARLRQLIVRWTQMAAAKPGIPRLINEEARHDTPRLAYLYSEVIGPFAASLEQLLKSVAETRNRTPPDLNIFMHMLVDGVSRYFGLQPLFHMQGAELPTSPSEIEALGEKFADFLLATVLGA